METLFPIFLDEVDNEALMEEVTNEELREVMHSFKKDKSLVIDGYIVEFFLVFMKKGLWKSVGGL